MISLVIVKNMSFFSIIGQGRHILMGKKKENNFLKIDLFYSEKTKAFSLECFTPVPVSNAIFLFIKHDFKVYNSIVFILADLSFNSLGLSRGLI